MNARSAFLLTATLFFALLFTHGAHAQQDQIKLENIRAQTDEMQEAVRRVHQRLAVVGAQAMTPGLAKTTIDVSNETSAAYKLVSARVVVDGQLQLDKKDLTGAERQLPVFTGATAPGEHTARIEVVLQGNGYGVFSYLRGFKITLSSSHTWNSTSDQPIRVTATLYELNDVTVPFQQRPQVRWVHGKNN